MLNAHISRAINALHHALDRLCTAEQLLQVITKHLDAQIRTHARDQLVKAQLYRLGKFIVVTHQFIQGFLHLFDQLGLRQIRIRPLITWLEHHIAIGNVRRHRIGGHFGCSGPCKCNLDLWKLADAFFDLRL